MASLSLRHIYKIYSGGVRAVSDFNLDIDDKEFIVFVGPSGCGKSTTLRMIAGLEDISEGELYIDDQLVNDREPKDRDIAMVFQNYALYPHMTVYDNMAFGLRLRHVPADIIDEKVQEAASILGIQHLLSRRPKALSGGQRQRVALGRAIVREPKVFLLDEPLSNLDAKLRVQMRTEITKIHHRLATTFIYVTHDQTEAMTMGTRIVVMKDGIVQQVDTPTTLYDNPANLFVACFLGSPQMNIFNAKLVEENGNVYALIGETNKVLIPKARAKRLIDVNTIGKDVLLGIRPEDVHYEQSLVEAHPDCVINATVDVIENLGNETILYLNVEGKEDYTISRVNARYSFTQGEQVKMYLATDHAHLFDPTTELTLMGVPDYNLIPAKTVAIEDTLAVVFGDTCIKLPASVTERITDPSIINNDVTLALPPKAFKPERTSDDDIEIEGVAEFFDNYPRFKAVYVSVAGMQNYLIVARGLDEPFNGGETIKAYINPADIQLFNDKDERIVTEKVVTGNETTGTITEDNGVYTYKFASANGTKSKLAYNNYAVEVGPSGDKVSKKLIESIETAIAEAPIHILSTGFSIDKDEIAKAPKMVITGVIKNLDEYRRNAVVTVEVPGFTGDVTAVIHKFSGYNVHDRIKLAVNPEAVIIGEYVNIGTLIAKAQEEGELRYKEILAARAKEKELEAAAKKPAKEQAAAKAEDEVESEPAKKTAKKPATKKPAAKKTTAKKPTEKKAPVKKPAAKKK
ncbi:MAG: sn-glycerol-3-phosphate ABC transporter ATP-binding protein UgpC [Clostridiales bacterium]|nr:sn-glycerol-3-phosphate ABC transporter ATP-binding protein UgpC [Clostridiales bacterium]